MLNDGSTGCRPSPIKLSCHRPARHAKPILSYRILSYLSASYLIASASKQKFQNMCIFCTPSPQLFVHFSFLTTFLPRSPVFQKQHRPGCPSICIPAPIYLTKCPTSTGKILPIAGMFDGQEHVPKLLPCSHTICLECLTR